MKYGLKSLLFTFAIFSGKCDMKVTFERFRMSRVIFKTDVTKWIFLFCVLLTTCFSHL